MERDHPRVSDPRAASKPAAGTTCQAIQEACETGPDGDPDRSQLLRRLPFLRLTERLVQSLSTARRAREVGGMEPFIPSRTGPEINTARAGPRCAMTRCARSAMASTGRGSRTPTWCNAKEVFDKALADRPHRRTRNCAREVRVSDAELLDLPSGGQKRGGVRNKVRVGCSTCRPGSMATARSRFFKLMATRDRRI